MNGQEGDYDVYGYNSNPTTMERAEDDESDDNTDVNAHVDVNTNKNMRHTPQQIQQLENFFKERPHPSTKQKSELGKKLNLETVQIKYWFRNKRAKMKVHEERHQNFVLRQENDTLRGEQEQLKQLLMLCTCITCGGPTYTGAVQQLQEENAKADSLIQMSVSPDVAQPSSSLMIPNPGRNTPHELDSISTFLVSPSAAQHGLSSNVATEIVKLAERMTLRYYSGIIGMHVENEGQNMRLMSRKNVNVLGEDTGIVMSAATSVWFPVNQKTMFDFLNTKILRGQWDLLTYEASIEETTKIQKSRTHNNYVSLLQIFGSCLSILQETWNDASGALMVFAPLTLDSVEELMRGEASYSVPILPSGFSIVPDGLETNGGGCLLTIGYQILVNTNPFADVGQDSVNFVEKLMACTIDRIKSALSIPT